MFCCMESWYNERTVNNFSVQFFGFCLVYLDLSFLLLDKNKLQMGDESIDEEFKILQTRARTYYLKTESDDLVASSSTPLNVKRELVINISWNAVTMNQQRNGHQKMRTVQTAFSLNLQSRQMVDYQLWKVLLNIFTICDQLIVIL